LPHPARLIRKITLADLFEAVVVLVPIDFTMVLTFCQPVSRIFSLRLSVSAVVMNPSGRKWKFFSISDKIRRSASAPQRIGLISKSHCC
jgi:hypothetical protein